MSSRRQPTNNRGYPLLALRGFGAVFALTCLVGVLLRSDESPTLPRFRQQHDRGVDIDGTRNGSVKFDSSLSTTAAGETATSEFSSRFGTNTRTWADTEEGRGCRSLFPSPLDALVGRGYSPSAMWAAMTDQILDASYYPPQHRTSNEYRQYVNAIFTFYTAARLRRSVAHPAPTGSVRKIVALVDSYKRQMKQYNDQQQQRVRKSNATVSSSTLADGPTVSPPDPILVLVLGGSVTNGVSANRNKVVQLKNKTQSREHYAWSGRLEHMLNGIFFPGDGPKGFQVFNYAMSSTNSQVGAAVLEYHLIPGIQDHPPHIVIDAYSTNDAFDPDLNVTYREHQQNLIRAAHATRPCDDDLPLIVLANDMHGYVDMDTPLEVTGSLYKLASWYNVMAVTYENVARHAAIANFVNLTYPNLLFGTGYGNVHLGMGMHIGLAWTLLFNLMGAFLDTCSDAVGVGTDDGTHNTTTTTTTTTTLDSMEWSLVEPPTKYHGRIASMDEASKEWKDRIEWRDRNCPVRVLHDETVPYATAPCTYAWTVNSVTITEPQHIDAALRGVLEQVDGWKADLVQDPNAARPPTFGTETPGSSFRLVLRNVTKATRYMTFMSMKSYRDMFINSNLRLSVRIGTEMDVSSSSMTAARVATYDIEGKNTKRTSTYFPHKFELPGVGARVGDTIRLDAKLVSGRAFKITAMAFCQM